MSSSINNSPKYRINEDQEDDVDQPNTQDSQPTSKALYRNFVLFCICFSVSHASVDTVLAFSSAQLGSDAGSYSGFILYIFYTFSTITLAKSSLRIFGPKSSVLYGIRLLLVYVASFLLTIIIPNSIAIFYIGAALGGIGAGILWTGQGTYYAINSLKYSQASEQHSDTDVSSTFSGIFAFTYLGCETIFKSLATGMYLINHKEFSWLEIVFGFYSFSALLSSELFNCFVMYLYDERVDDAVDEEIDIPLSNTVNTVNSVNTALIENKASDIRRDIISLITFIYSNKLIKLLIPIQLSFGFYSSFVNYYINTKIVAEHNGIGYIGVLSALATIVASVLSIPLAYVANKLGKVYIIIIGELAFTFASILLIKFDDSEMAQWPLIITFYILYGIGRCVWEGINKAVIADFFKHPIERDMSYAFIYFSSGLSAAIGFLSYQFMSRAALIYLNLVVPVISIISFLYAYRVYKLSNNHDLHINKFSSVLSECFDATEDDYVNPIRFTNLN